MYYVRFNTVKGKPKEFVFNDNSVEIEDLVTLAELHHNLSVHHGKPQNVYIYHNADLVRTIGQ